MGLQEREKKKGVRKLSRGLIQNAQDLERTTPGRQGLGGRQEGAQREALCAHAAPGCWELKEVKADL